MAAKKPAIEMWAIEKLIPYDKNAKIHTQGQVENLAKVIKSQGWDVPIVADKDGVIIKGHGRRLAALHLGYKEVPVICRRDLTPAQVKAARLSDNHVALTEFDTTLIQEEIAALNVEGFDVSEMGFSAKELDMMIRDMDTVNVEAFESDKAPDADTASKSEALTKATDKGKETVLDLAAVLGFKSVPASAERALVRFQSYAESETDETGDKAFVKFCQSIVADIEARA